ncbi:MAG TPA: tetratricopeptide repeat protein [Chitinophagaceae bacterium]|nr:tetratricopeptide repeat protein [Chitinophagaceae bacterium]
MFLLLIGMLPFPFLSYSQPVELDAKKWATELNKKANSANENFTKIDYELAKLDSTTVFKFLNEVGSRGKSYGDYFQARYNSLVARQIFFWKVYGKNPLQIATREKDDIRRLMEDAMDRAYRTEDDYLIALVSTKYAGMAYQLGYTGTAVMYAMKSVDLYEKLAYDLKPGSYQFLAEMLYRVREYRDCIKYGKKAITAWQHSPNEHKPFTVSCFNTVALGYHRLQLYDSALLFYNQALQLAKKINIPVWIGIVSGNIAQIYYEQKLYDTAYTLFKNDYRISKDSGYYDNAANSLQWAAKANLAMGNSSSALAEVRESFGLLKLWPDAGYLRNAYYTITQIFRQTHNYDSAFYYTNLYAALNDSLEKVVTANSMAISKAKLNDESSRYSIQKLNREKKSQLQFRNFVIALIVLISIIALLYINRLRIRHLHKEQLALQEKNATEQMAREQLQLVTQSLIEKSGLVEELQRQLNNRNVSAERQELTTTIANLTILTETDWDKFKSLFEQLYPGFFLNLQEKVTDITVAELRMAALTRLRLSTPQIASILGISTNSVYKTKQRLRQRLNLEGERDVEEAIANI